MEESKTRIRFFSKDDMWKAMAVISVRLDTYHIDVDFGDLSLTIKHS